MPDEQPVLLPDPIGLLLLPGFVALPYVALTEALRIANRFLRADPFDIRVLSATGAPVADKGGMLHPVDAAAQAAGPLGTLLIVADLDPEPHVTPALAAWLRGLARGRTVLGGIDLGALVLAKVGLLRDRSVAVHWEFAAAFREQFPAITLRDQLFVFDGPRVTCAGGFAAFDMALAAIEARHGRTLALRVSELAIYPLPRAATVPQRPPAADRMSVGQPPALAAVIELMERHIEAPLPVAELAARGGVSERHLLRLVMRQFGCAPSRLYQRVRLDHARALLHRTALSVAEVALASGFQSASHFTRAYRDAFGLPPSQERRSQARTPAYAPFQPLQPAFV